MDTNLITTLLAIVKASPGNIYAVMCAIIFSIISKSLITVSINNKLLPFEEDGLLYLLILDISKNETSIITISFLTFILLYYLVIFVLRKNKTDPVEKKLEENDFLLKNNKITEEKHNENQTNIFNQIFILN